MTRRFEIRFDAARRDVTTASSRVAFTWAKRGVASALGVVLALYVVGLAVPEARGDEEAAIEEARATGRAKETPTSSRIEYVPQAPRAGR